MWLRLLAMFVVIVVPFWLGWKRICDPMDGDFSSQTLWARKNIP